MKKQTKTLVLNNTQAKELLGITSFSGKAINTAIISLKSVGAGK
ncbi:MAG: hypothetical protein QF872_04130 [Gammaproteobacteria bacterium]|nr:hypothetical protein [Gammaproteobacteria bacterium]